MQVWSQSSSQHDTWLCVVFILNIRFPRFHISCCVKITSVTLTNMSGGVWDSGVERSWLEVVGLNLSPSIHMSRVLLGTQVLLQLFPLSYINACSLLYNTNYLTNGFNIPFIATDISFCAHKEDYVSHLIS